MEKRAETAQLHVEIDISGRKLRRPCFRCRVQHHYGALRGCQSERKKRCNDTPLAPQWQPCPLRPSHIGSRLAAPHPPRYTSVSKLGVQTIRLEPSEEGWTIGPCSKIASKSPGFRGTQIFTPTSDIDQKDLNVQLQLLTGSGLLPPLLADATRSCRKGQHQLQGLQGNMGLGVKGPMAEGRSMPKPYLWSSAVCCVSATSKSRK